MLHPNCLFNKLNHKHSIITKTVKDWTQTPNNRGLESTELTGKIYKVMLSAFTNLFIKEPATDIAGVTLTHEEPTKLDQTCTALKYKLKIQVDAIRKPTSVSNGQISSNIRLIRTRHTDIQIHLTTVALETQNSSHSWVHDSSMLEYRSRKR